MHPRSRPLKLGISFQYVPPTLDIRALIRDCSTLLSGNTLFPETWLRPSAWAGPSVLVGQGGLTQPEKETVAGLGLCLHRPILQSAAVAERERVSQMFAEATATLQSFQTEVLGFIEEGEATMLGRSQGDLRRQEEQRSRLSRARHNLSQVPEADSVSFLQVRVAHEPRGDRVRGWSEKGRQGDGYLAFPDSGYLPWLGGATAAEP